MPGVSAQTMPLALLALVIATLIMWLSARIVAVPQASMRRCFIATLGVSMIMGAVFTAMSAMGSVIGLVLGAVGVVGSILLLRRVFDIPTMPAVLIFVVNVMVQVILVSIYLRPFLNKPPTT